MKAGKHCSSVLNGKLPWKLAAAQSLGLVCFDGVNYHSGDLDSRVWCLKEPQCYKNLLWCELGFALVG